MLEGTTEQFTAQDVDQFGNPMPLAADRRLDVQRHGTIDQSGLYTAPNTVETDTITAVGGTATVTATVNVIAPSGGIRLPAPGKAGSPVVATAVRAAPAVAAAVRPAAPAGKPAALDLRWRPRERLRPTPAAGRRAVPFVGQCPRFALSAAGRRGAAVERVGLRRPAAAFSSEQMGHGNSSRCRYSPCSGNLGVGSHLANKP